MAAGNYTIHVLAAQSGIAARTLRDWIKHKVLPKPLGRVRSARYDDRHLLRARAIQQLRATGAPLRDIRIRLAALSDGTRLLMPRWAMSFLKGPMTRVEIRRALGERAWERG